MDWKEVNEIPEGETLMVYVRDEGGVYPAWKITTAVFNRENGWKYQMFTDQHDSSDVRKNVLAWSEFTYPRMQ